MRSVGLRAGQDPDDHSEISVVKHFERFRIHSIISDISDGSLRRDAGQQVAKGISHGCSIKTELDSTFEGMESKAGMPQSEWTEDLIRFFTDL
jgi:hypothetical protein